MKKNPVELLTIVNPDEDAEKISLSRRDYQMLGFGATAGIIGVYLSGRIGDLLSGRTTQTQTLVAPAAPGSGFAGYVILGVLGLAGWYVWSRYKTPAGAPDAVPLRNPGKKYHRREKSSASGTRYFVRVVGTNEIYPKPGSEDYPGGYSLRSAQDFARIGSQTGEPRKVLRGSSHGPVVRKYEDGKRVWPVTVAQARSLRPAERPSKLRESA